MPVVLWTDALIFLLVAAVIGFALFVRRREHLRSPWRRVMHSRLGMMAAVVLAVYVGIGLLDSLHFHPRPHQKEGDGPTQYTAEVLSVFDLLVTPLWERVEKTYSSPFATHLYVRESRYLADGKQARDFPRLKFAGSHLAHLGDKTGDILLTSLRAIVAGGIAWALFAGAVVTYLGSREHLSFRAMVRAIWRGDTEVPWHVTLLTVGALLLLGFLVVNLAGKYHILGTDKVGQDVLYQALKSIRTGLAIGTLTTLVMLPFAVLLGLMAGYFRGWVDDVIQYVYTTLNSIPGVLLIAAVILMAQVYMANHADSFQTLADRADLRLLFLCVILGITSWTGLCRLLRGETLKLREVEHIQAAQALGVGHFAIILRHILPNVMHIVLISVVLDFSALVLAEAVLAYVNIGVDPTTNSWGNMINGARLEMAREPIVWWSLTAAFVFMFTLVLAANLFSDAVRDAFDPRMK